MPFHCTGRLLQTLAMIEWEKVKVSHQNLTKKQISRPPVQSIENKIKIHARLFVCCSMEWNPIHKNKINCRWLDQSSSPHDHRVETNRWAWLQSDSRKPRPTTTTTETEPTADDETVPSSCEEKNVPADSQQWKEDDRAHAHVRSFTIATKEMI